MSKENSDEKPVVIKIIMPHDSKEDESISVGALIGFDEYRKELAKQAHDLIDKALSEFDGSNKKEIEARLHETLTFDYPKLAGSAAYEIEKLVDTLMEEKREKALNKVLDAYRGGNRALRNRLREKLGPNWPKSKKYVKIVEEFEKEIRKRLKA